MSEYIIHPGNNTVELISCGNCKLQFGKKRFDEGRNMLNQNFERDIHYNRHLNDSINATFLGEFTRSSVAHIKQGTPAKGMKVEQGTGNVKTDLTANEIYKTKTTPVSSSADYSEGRPHFFNKQSKEAMRKESHNKIERKRMNFINDRIRELGNLLPETAKRRSNQRKGLILKEAVDFLRQLHKEQCIIRQLQNKIEEIDKEIEKLTLRLKNIELQVDYSGNKDHHEGNKNNDFKEAHDKNVVLQEVPFQDMTFQANQLRHYPTY